MSQLRSYLSGIQKELESLTASVILARDALDRRGEISRRERRDLLQVARVLGSLLPASLARNLERMLIDKAAVGAKRGRGLLAWKDCFNYRGHSSSIAGEDVLWVAVPMTYGKPSRLKLNESVPAAILRARSLDAKPDKRKPLWSQLNRIVALEPMRDEYLKSPVHWAELCDFEGLARSVNYSRPQLAWLVRHGRIPYLVFDKKKWFLPLEVEATLEQAKRDGTIRGPSWGMRKVAVQRVQGPSRSAVGL